MVCLDSHCVHLSNHPAGPLHEHKEIDLGHQQPTSHWEDLFLYYQSEMHCSKRSFRIMVYLKFDSSCDNCQPELEVSRVG